MGTPPTVRNSEGLTQSGRLTYANTEKYIEVNGLNIHYHEAGEDHEHTVVFIHGGGLGASGWFNFYLNVEPFSERYRTILIDLPNFGRSDSIELLDVDIAKFEADLISDFLRAKSIGKATLIGNSKGGFDAIAFSVHHPEQLELNVLMGTFTGPSTFDVAPPHGTSVIFDMFREPSRELVEKLLHLFVYDDSFVDDGWVDLRWNAALDADKRGHRAAVLNSRPIYVDYSTRLSEAHAPTLVIYGAHDRFAALDSSVALMRRYPNSELHIFRNCGHWVQFELSEKFNDLVLRWMETELSSLTEVSA